MYKRTNYSINDDGYYLFFKKHYIGHFHYNSQINTRWTKDLNIKINPKLSLVWGKMFLTSKLGRST
jgi:hypothetical protein